MRHLDVAPSTAPLSVGDRPTTDKTADSRPVRARLAGWVAGRRYRVEPTDTAIDTDRAGREPFGLRVGLPFVVWVLSGISSILAATGQIEFARWAGITDWRQYLVPAGLELVAGAFLLLGYRRARRGHPPTLMWAFAAMVGGFAFYTNVVHAGARAWMVFGGATVVTLLSWFAKLYDDYREFRERMDQTGLGWLWVNSTRLAFRATLVGHRLRIRTVTKKVEHAETWIAVFDDAKSAKVKGWRLRRRTAWRAVLRRANAQVADLPTFATVERVAIVDRPAAENRPTDSPIQAAPTDSPGPAALTDKPEPARTEPDKSVPTAPSTDSPGPTAPSTDSRPVAVGPTATDRAPTGKRPTTGRRADRPTHLRAVHSPAAIANARLIRQRYGDKLPASNNQVQIEMGGQGGKWSWDRATPAIAAYLAGADLDNDQEPSTPPVLETHHAAQAAGQ